MIVWHAVPRAQTTEHAMTSNIRIEPVASSRIFAMGHDAETNTLSVQFRRSDESPGSVYHYANVTAAEFAEMKAAESIGTHFRRHFKADPERYPYTLIEKVGPAPKPERKA